MKEYLQELVSRSGVEAVFVCDTDGALIDAVHSHNRFTDPVETLGKLLNRADTGLQSLQHGGLLESEWVYAQGRILVRSVGQGLLCLICDRSVNLQLLTTKVDEVRDQIQISISARPRQHSPEDLAQLKAELIVVAREMLGEHSTKVVAALQAAETSLGSIEQACEQAEKITQLFIDRKNAGKLGDRMRAVLDGYR